MPDSAENHFSLEESVNNAFVSDGKTSEEHFLYFPSKYDEHLFQRNLRSCNKVYSVDTSVLLIDPFAPFYITGNRIPEDLQVEFSNRYGLNISYESLGEPNNFILSQIVEKELDKIKDNRKKDGFVRFMARRALEVLRYIYDIGRKNGERPAEGVTLENGAKFLYQIHDEQNFKKHFERYFEPDNDIRIIYDILSIKPLLEEGQVLTLITEDGGFVNKAWAIGADFNLENYKREQITRYDSIYSGKLNLELDEDLKKKYFDIEIFLRKDLLDILSDFKINLNLIHPNMILKIESPLSEDKPWKNYLFVTGDSNHLRPAVNFEQYIRDCQEMDKHLLSKNANTHKKEFKINSDKVVHKLNRIKDKIRKSNSKIMQKDLFDLILRELKLEKPQSLEMSLEQEFYSVKELFASFPFHKNIHPEGDQIPYFELLLSKEIPVVSVIGEQGAGKSVLALLAGLYQIWKGDYERISYIRSTREMGAQSIGFLPGSESDKMEPWKRSVRDNLIDIFYDREQRGDLLYKKRLEEFILSLEKIGLVEFLTPQFLQGRTLNDRFIIVDEAQNFPRTVASIILGRTGETSKMVFLGDPKQLDAVQYSDRFVNKYNTGIIHIAERLKDLPIAAHITLPKNFNKRSEASKAATLL